MTGLVRKMVSTKHIILDSEPRIETRRFAYKAGALTLVTVGKVQANG
jgi:hypothetical protein